MDADSLAHAYEILGLVVLKQKKGNFKFLLKYLLRQFNSEDVEGSDDGCSSWYTNAKLHNHLRLSRPPPFLKKKIKHLFVFEISGNNLPFSLTVTSFLRIWFGDTRQLCWWYLLRRWYHKRNSSTFWKLTLNVSY